jgi:putative Ca2+/H+ antiporter (TMEM165/GDT1 family)
MEALLPVFIAVLLAEIGGRTQASGNALSMAYPQHPLSILAR